MSKPNGSKCPTCTQEGEQVTSTVLQAKLGRKACRCWNRNCATMVFNRYEEGQ